MKQQTKLCINQIYINQLFALKPNGIKYYLSDVWRNNNGVCYQYHSIKNSAKMYITANEFLTVYV
jgi:hypothetical protein